MQKRYIWLAGSFPSLIVIQGRGYRSQRTMYRLKHDDGELVIFGYSNPCFWLENRGIFRAGQAPHSYVLTDEGERLFRQLLASGAGMKINQQIREVNGRF